jgi:hypothetical protein
LIVGHTRLKAAERLGLKFVPVHVARDLTPERARAYRLADNATGEIATWDYDLLPIELAGLQEVGFDLGLLGFDEEELARAMSGDVKGWWTRTTSPRRPTRRSHGPVIYGFSGITGSFAATAARPRTWTD